jgi:very-short-patch-repair endonuclease
MRKKIKKPTLEEKLLKHALEAHGILVYAQVKDGHKTIDLTIPTARINIEVDGKQHLTDPHQIISDLSRGHYSDALGYQTIHIPNSYVHNDLARVSSALAAAAKFREKQTHRLAA